MTILEKKRQRIFNDLLDRYTLEELLEMFDIDVTDVLEDLFQSGMIDEDLLDRVSELSYD